MKNKLNMYDDVMSGYLEMIKNEKRPLSMGYGQLWVLCKDARGQQWKMYFTLMRLRYFISHKKVYRLTQEPKLLKQKYKRAEKTFARYTSTTTGTKVAIGRSLLKQY